MPHQDSVGPLCYNMSMLNIANLTLVNLVPIDTES